MSGPGAIRAVEREQPADRSAVTPADVVPDRGRGQPLDPAVRAQAEHAYSADLSGVRVHTGSAAHKAARALRARAYTIGSDVVLGADGHRALLHELAHVVQQQIGGAPPAGHAGGAHEQGARVAASAARRGESGLSVGGGTAVGVARSPEDEEPESEQPATPAVASNGGEPQSGQPTATAPVATDEEPASGPPATATTPAAVAPPKKATRPGRPRKPGSSYVMPGIVAGDRARYHPPGAPEVIVQKRPSPRPALAAPLNESEAAMLREADELVERLGRPLKAGVKAVTADRPVHRQGFGKASGPGAAHGGGAATTEKVMETGQAIGHVFTPNSSKDEGVPGQAAASHAEKQAAIDNPGRAVAVDLAMCSDCFAFFGRLAQHRGVPLVVKEPNGTWVFRADGVRIRRTPTDELIMHPDGRVSAGPARPAVSQPGGSGPKKTDGGSSPPPSGSGGAVVAPAAGAAATSTAVPPTPDPASGPDAKTAAKNPVARPRPTEDQRLMRRLSNELRDSGAELRAANQILDDLDKVEAQGGLTDAQKATKAITAKRAEALEKSMTKADADLRLLIEPGATDAARNEMRARRGSKETIGPARESTSTGLRLSDKGLQSKDSTVTSRLDQGSSRTVTDDRTRTLTSTGYADTRDVSAKVVTGDVTTTTSRGSSTGVSIAGGDVTASRSRTSKTDVQDAASGGRESTARTDTTSVGTGGVVSSTETVRRIDDLQVKEKQSSGLARSDGQLGYQRSSSTSRGTVDDEGSLTKGSERTSTLNAGVIAGPGQAGAAVKGTAGVTQTHRKGVTTGQQVTLGGKVLVTCQELPGSSPPMFRVGLTINLNGGLTLTGGADKKAVADVSGGGNVGASVSASGSLTGTFTQKMSEEETAAYLGAVRDNKSYGAYRELKVIELAGHGAWTQAKDLLGSLNAAAGDPKAVRAMREGQSVEDKVSGEAGASLTAGGTSKGGASAGIKLGYTVSGSIARTVTREGGKIIIKLEVLRQGTAAGGLSGGYGVASFGVSGTQGTLTGQGITFVLDPDKDADFDARLARIMSTTSVETLRELGKAETTWVTSSTMTTGSSRSSTVSAGALGVGLEIGEESSYTEAVTTDKTGVSKDITATGGGGASISVPVGPKITHKTTDTFAAKVRSDNTASGDASTVQTNTDFTKTVKNFADAPIATISGAVTGSAPVLAQRSDSSGTKVDDADFQAIIGLASNSSAWTQAFLNGNGMVNDALQDWNSTRRRVLAAGNDREAVVKALADFQQGGARRGGVVQAAFGKAGAGIRYEFPEELADQKAGYEELIVGDPAAAARVLSAAGNKEEARKKLTADIARLTKMQAEITAKEANVKNPAVLGEMLRRIGDRATVLRRELRTLDAPAPVAPTPQAGRGTAATAPTAAAPAAAEQAASQAAKEDRAARISSAVSTLTAFRARENRMFALINSEYDHWYRKEDIVLVTNTLTELKAMYQEWDSQLAVLKAALKEDGAPESSADKYAPNRTEWDKQYKRAITW